MCCQILCDQALSPFCRFVIYIYKSRRLLNKLHSIAVCGCLLAHAMAFFMQIVMIFSSCFACDCLHFLCVVLNVLIMVLP